MEKKIVSGEPRVVLTKPFNPAKFLGQGWTTWKGPVDGDGLSGEEDVDCRSLALSEIDLSVISFEICLVGCGEEKLRRLKDRPELIRLGANVFLGLWSDYQVDKENSALEWLYEAKKITYLDFFGTVLRGPRGGRHVLCLCRRGSEWNWFFSWLDLDWSVGHPSAVRAS